MVQSLLVMSSNFHTLIIHGSDIARYRPQFSYVSHHKMALPAQKLTGRDVFTAAHSIILISRQGKLNSDIAIVNTHATIFSVLQTRLTGEF
jgi:hypothetical protein